MFDRDIVEFFACLSESSEGPREVTEVAILVQIDLGRISHYHIDPQSLRIYQ